jgi:hypothetical protein
MWCGLRRQNLACVRATGNSMRRMKNEYLCVTVCYFICVLFYTSCMIKIYLEWQENDINKAWNSQPRLTYRVFFKTVFTKWVGSAMYVTMNTDNMFSKLLRRPISALLAKELIQLPYINFLWRQYDTVSQATCFSRAAV